MLALRYSKQIILACALLKTPPGPPPKTGKHRYVFLAFAPANGTSQPLNLTKLSGRQHWGTGKEREGVRHWAKENGLVPVAGNFIYSQNKKQ